MQQENNSKLPKPSGLKPPTVFMKRPRSQEDVKQEIPATAISVKPGPAFRLKRRSKSVSDLKSTGGIYKPLRKELSSVRQGLPSKSRPCATEKAQVSVKNVPKAAPTNGTRPAVKRAAQTAGDIVNKIAKKSKVPDWDYKSRYGLLNEKHIVVQAKLAELTEKLSGFATIENDFKLLETNHQKVTHDYAKLMDEITQLRANYKILENSNKDLTNDLNKTTELYSKEQTETRDLRSRLEKVLEENSVLKVKAEESLQIPTLKSKILQQDNLRRIMHNTIQDLKGNIRVFCRVRPAINDTENRYVQCCIDYLNNNSLEIRKSKESLSSLGKPTESKAEFNFDRVFEPVSSQIELFEELAHLVQSALDGYNVCVFAYGQTGSGKTYTMQGLNNPEDLGLIPRAIDLIFQSVAELKLSNWNYEIKASFLEIYNENLIDLLNPNGNQNLDICFNEGKGTTVKKLIIQPMNSAQKLKNTMVKALENRKVASTNFNERSSRSHAVTTIYITGKNIESGILCDGTINLVDLAGSESAKTSTSERLTETKSINKSLAELGNVMLALYNNERHIPYRNSKLTYLLQSSLGGNSKTLMIVNIAPFEQNFAESINSLRFASKVKEVKTSAKKHKLKM